MEVSTFKTEIGLIKEEDNVVVDEHNTSLRQKEFKEEFEDGNKNLKLQDGFIIKQEIGIDGFINNRFDPKYGNWDEQFQILPPSNKNYLNEIMKEDSIEAFKDEKAVQPRYWDKSDDHFYRKEECKIEFSDWNEGVIKEEIKLEETNFSIKSPEPFEDRNELQEERVDSANEPVINQSSFSLEKTTEKTTCSSNNQSNGNEESSHHCTVCEESFKSDQDLKQVSCHGNTLKAKVKKYPCSECGKTFMFQKELKIHDNMCHNLRCFYCPMTFHTKSALNSHTQSHNNAVFKRDYVCEICGRVFNFQSNLARHKKLHSELKPYTCENCGKGFIRLDHFKLHQHVRKHGGKSSKAYPKETLDVEEFVCDTCGRGFKVKQRLRDHLKLHTENRPHVCQVCNRAFKQIYNLNQHLLSHDGPRDFICGVCNKGFRRKAFLKQHMLVHTKEKNYTCEMCGKKYYKSCHVKEHKRKAHSNPETTRETKLTVKKIALSH